MGFVKKMVKEAATSAFTEFATGVVTEIVVPKIKQVLVNCGWLEKDEDDDITVVPLGDEPKGETK